jgi:hypothetical protein
VNWHDVATPLIACIGVVLAALIGGLFGHLAARRNAEAAVQDAYTRAHEAARKDWGVHLEAVQRWCTTQAEELHELGQRQGATEMALEAEKTARGRAERLYRIALSYLHRIFSWAAYHVPGEPLPAPPPDLMADLDGWPFQPKGDLGPKLVTE